MLEAVDQIALSHRQRPSDTKPGEVADALRALAFATSDAAAAQAYHRVLFAVGNDHRGSYFPIVLDAIPYLGEILTSGTRPARARTLDVLIDLIASFGPDPDVVARDGLRPEDLPPLIRTHIETLRPVLEELGANTSEPDVQSLARDLVGYLADDS